MAGRVPDSASLCCVITHMGHILLLGGSLLWFAWACSAQAGDFSGNGTSSEPGTEKLTPTLEAGTAWSARQDSSARLWLAFYAPNGDLSLRDPDGRPTTVASPKKGDQPSGLHLGPLGEGMGLLWRDTSKRAQLRLVNSQALDDPLPIDSPSRP